MKCKAFISRVPDAQALTRQYFARQDGRRERSQYQPLQRAMYGPRPIGWIVRLPGQVDYGLIRDAQFDFPFITQLAAQIIDLQSHNAFQLGGS